MNVACQAMKKKINTYQQVLLENQAIIGMILLDRYHKGAMHDKTTRRGAIEYMRKILPSPSASLALATTPLLAQSGIMKCFS